MWKLIEDKDEAWKYFEANLLWYGTPKNGGMVHYPPDSWSTEDWQDGFDDQPYRNYICIEE